MRDGVLQGVLEALAQDLEVRGQLDLSECFIDATFVIAKKGAREWVRLSGVEEPLAAGSIWSSCLVSNNGMIRPAKGSLVARSWQFQTLLVLASPSTLRLLARMKSPWYSKLSHLDTSREHLGVS